jgi:hypothetical protein
MLSKSFQEMSKVDVSGYLKAREDAKNVMYLPWAACKKLLHDHGAETVMFWPVAGPDGSTLRHSGEEFTDKNGVKNRCYEVVVHIVVDNLEWDTVYPVLNGNNPVKDNGMNQLRVHNAVRRAFVKGVAERIGLGFSLWLNDDDLPEEVDDLNRHDLAKCMQRMKELISNRINSGLPLSVIADRLGRTEEEIRGMMGWYKVLATTEQAIWEMQP